MNLGDQAFVVLQAFREEVGLDGVTVERDPDGDDGAGFARGAHAFVFCRGRARVRLVVPLGCMVEALRQCRERFWVGSNMLYWEGAVRRMRERLLEEVD